MTAQTALQRYTSGSDIVARSPLLRRVEIRAQKRNEPERHHYCCRYIELFVWLSRGVFVGFELDYALRTDEERSIRWSETEGLEFCEVQAARDDDRRKQVLVPITDTEPPLLFVAAVFAAASRNIDSHTRRYVLTKLVAAAH